MTAYCSPPVALSRAPRAPWWRTLRAWLGGTFGRLERADLARLLERARRLSFQRPDVRNRERIIQAIDAIDQHLGWKPVDREIRRNMPGADESAWPWHPREPS
jgi:hypothetical protein